jgi:hypothetical protein
LRVVDGYFVNWAQNILRFPPVAGKTANAAAVFAMINQRLDLGNLFFNSTHLRPG